MLLRLLLILLLNYYKCPHSNQNVLGCFFICTAESWRMLVFFVLMSFFVLFLTLINPYLMPYVTSYPILTYHILSCLIFSFHHLSHEDSLQTFSSSLSPTFVCHVVRPPFLYLPSIVFCLLFSYLFLIYSVKGGRGGVSTKYPCSHRQL